MPSLLDTVYEWISERLSVLGAKSESPIFVGIQGPQGCGKSTLCAQLATALQDRPSAVSVLALGLDDFYYAWEQQPRSSPNRLLSAGRGNPGTHDVGLCLETLEMLQAMNSYGSCHGTSVSIPLPRFDKSLHGGEGDRIVRLETIRLPLHLVIVEGWCLGFEAIQDASGFLLDADTAEINQHLKSYHAIYSFFDLFIQLKIEHLDWIYEWRLEQEASLRKHCPQSPCLSDEQVMALVSRCLPIYRLYYFNGAQDHGSIHGLPKENRLTLKLNKDRHVIY